MILPPVRTVDYHTAGEPFRIVAAPPVTLRGATVAERPVVRDRAAEFTASGAVGPLLQRSDEALRRLRDDLASLDAAAVPANVRRDPAHPVPYTESKGAVLLHIIEELYQHLGQMELTRDLLLAGPAE